MRILVTETASEAAGVAADMVERYISSTPSPVLGLATGSTMKAVFAELVQRHRERSLSFAGVDAYLLDEYLDLDRDDSRAFRNVVCRLLASHIDIGLAAVHGPDPWAPDLIAECARYEQAVREASVGLQLLGIGTNGHIAFNEPGSWLGSTTRVVALSEQTRSDNARLFPAARFVPAWAITQGIATVLAASELVLVACGEHKADAVTRAIEGPVTTDVPASSIQIHPNVTVLLDELAASCLTRSVLLDERLHRWSNPDNNLQKGANK